MLQPCFVHLLLAGVVLLVLFFLIAVFSRGGPSEKISAGAVAPELAGISALSLTELGSVAQRLFNELGLLTESQHEQPGRFDLVMHDPTPVTGQKVYLRCLLTPAEVGAVQSAEVQAALDTARASQLNKAVVVTPGLFSDEARLVSQQAAVELIDGARLAELLRAHLPDVANRLGVPR
jgi:hypothetical protein